MPSLVEMGKNVLLPMYIYLVILGKDVTFIRNLPHVGRIFVKFVTGPVVFGEDG